MISKALLKKAEKAADILLEKPGRKCRCRILRVSSAGGNIVNYKCHCGKTKTERQMTPREQKAYRVSWQKTPEIHKLWHLFLKRFKKQEEWRWVSYDLMERVEYFAKKHPEIVITSVDDSYHASSSVVFVPHKDKHHVWGITVLYIPQCNGEKPIEFFMYPGHLKEMLGALNTLAKLMRSFGDRTLNGFTKGEQDSIFNAFKPMSWKKAFASGQSK